jgi:hypothetical protein
MSTLTHSPSAHTILPARTLARLAGWALLLMAALAGFSYGYALDGLLVAGDAPATALALFDHMLTFRWGIVGWVLIALCDLVVAWALYQLFRETHLAVSLLTAGLRLIYTVVLCLAIYHLLPILGLTPADELAAGGAQVERWLAGFQHTWSLGLIIFGAHLMGLGYLVLRNEYVPQVLGYLLLVAGVGYVLVHLGKTAFPGYDEQVSLAETILALPMALSEIGLAIWLLWRGGRQK